MRVLFIAVVLYGLAAGGLAGQSGQLTAADLDDNLNFAFFLTYKANAVSGSGKGQGQVANQKLPNPNLSDRVRVHVTDSAGAPFSCAVVEAKTSSGSSSVELPSGTDGLLSLFPELDGLPSEGSLSLRAAAHGGTCPEDCSELHSNIAPGDTVTLQVPSISSPPSRLDVAFVVDTTGSMGDELNYLREEVHSILDGLHSSDGGNVDSRAALVLYRDHGDEYVVETTPFDTVSAGAGAIGALQGATANGGGDYPEAMEEGLEAAISLEWRSGNTARVLFLVADAPPHDENLQRTLDAALAARKKGIRVYGLAASGVADTAEYLMRLLAVTTGARHLWLTDDSGIGNSHQMPKVQCYRVTRLDQLLSRVLEAELQGARIEADQSEILREVGAQDSGVCLIDLSTTTTPPTTTATSSTSESTTSTQEVYDTPEVFSTGDGAAGADGDVAEGMPSPTALGSMASMAGGSDATDGAAATAPVAAWTFFGFALALGRRVH